MAMSRDPGSIAILKLRSSLNWRYEGKITAS